VCKLTLEYEDDKVEEMYYINKEILEEDGKGEKNTFIIGEWKGVVEDTVTQHGLRRENQRSNVQQLL
jgi:hypothetical protein